MASRLPIRILEKDNNRRGDLFGRLMSDLFVALGYDDVRLNLARSGREIDLEAEHRLEKRVALAECKALAEPVGGKEVNAFAGKLRPEQHRKQGIALTPYFVSLSGFTETARDQEAESGEDRVILVDGARVLAELITGRILVPLERATEKAGHLNVAPSSLDLDSQPELLAHSSGWLWAIYYAQGKHRTHFALIHADGTPLTLPMAREVIEADRNAGGSLHKLACLNREPVVSADAQQIESSALAEYYRYITAECGYILLDGLPADAEVGSRRLPLENLFVPLHVGAPGTAASRSLEEPASTEFESAPSGERQPVGEVLAEHSRLAILASPGGGKSTLVKRLAVAYADPHRRMLANDRLPDRSWLPLLLRCRELRDRARSPFTELVDHVATRACLGESGKAFRAAVDRALRLGRVLLLVDGLDEISHAGDRTAFVRSLRTFLAVYPSISLVVTSREAGFRHVAGLLATVCLQRRLADLDTHNIHSLCTAWHREVVGDRPDVISDARQLADAIIANDRIRRLSVNPLLLTTLLLVKRWVGQFGLVPIFETTG